jgi:serine O-acetyltransferase
VVIGETAEIGDDCTLYHGVTLGGTSWRRGKRHPTLGAGCVVGAGAKILGPVTLGDQVKVGANSVVIDNVPAASTVVGIPAKAVRTRPSRAPNPQGIDLDHHLIPDPVASAIHCLLERIRLLETQVGSHGCIPGGTEPEDECHHCDAVMVCDPADAVRGVGRGRTPGPAHSHPT